jgi:dienelactone hydrolase
MTNQVSAHKERLHIKNKEWDLIADWQNHKTPELKGIVLLLHKAAGNRSAYERMANLLSQRGYASLKVDLRGHGESINVRAFNPNLSRFENPKSPEIAANFELIKKGYLDIIAVVKWLKANKRIEQVPFAIIGSSYTGEEMVKASEVIGWADAYIALAPGNFSSRSVAKIDPTKKPWLFVRATKEMSFMDNIFETIDKGSNAEIWILPGKGHATDLFEQNDALEEKLINWLHKKLYK